MNGFTIKNIIYLLFIATIFYFIVGKIFKLIKFKKLNKLKKGIYFSIFILLFYFFYKVLPVLLFGNSKIIEGMVMDDLSESQTKAAKDDEKSDEKSDDNIDYTKGWDIADNFRKNFCSKTPIHVDQFFFDNRSDKPENPTETKNSVYLGNPEGGLIWGARKELYDSTTKKQNRKYSQAVIDQMEKYGNRVDSTSFTKENGCITNLKADNGTTGTLSQMCNPKCNFKFTGKKTDTTKK